jgi:hypothetical protein
MTAALALLSVVGTALALGAIAWGAWDIGVTRLLVWLARYHVRREQAEDAIVRNGEGDNGKRIL